MGTFFDFSAWRARMGGLTQAEAAERLGLAARDSLTKIETGARKPGRPLILLAQALERLREIDSADGPRHSDPTAT